MMFLLAQAIQVTGMQLLLFAFIPMWALARWWNATERWFVALVAGLASAAVLGRLCDRSGVSVGVALGLWLAGWIVFGVVARRAKTTFADVVRMDWLLLAVLILAWVVRMIHPLQTWALGQSDAYSHLGFLCDVLGKGRLKNAEYPSAYAWVMAFPAWLLRGHPYWVARFGGAFFGMGLVLCTYMLSFRLKGRTAALAAAALVAGCPLFFLLQKTGVGCFANQLGLLLVPAALWAYTSGQRGWLAVVLIALAVSVPMLLLHILLLVGLLALSDRCSWQGRLIIMGLLVLVFALVLGIFLCLPPCRGRVIVAMLTGRDYLTITEECRGVLFRLLLSDFISIKRVGLGSLITNGASGLLAVTFVSSFVFGIRRSDAAWRIIGSWGMLSCVNVIFGVFQFSNYQREGWSMLIALACLGGLLFDVVWRWWSSRLGHGILAAGFSLGIMGGLLFPPSHEILAGPSESDVVKFLLELDPSVTVVKRSETINLSWQGDVIRTLHPRTISEVRDICKTNGPVIYLREKRISLLPISPVMRILQPAQTDANEKTLMKIDDGNRKLEEQLHEYEVCVVKVSPYLDVWQIQAK